MDDIDEISRETKALIEKELSSIAPLPPQKIFSSEEILTALFRGQDGDAWLAKHLFKDRFCFDHAANRWYEWRDHFWEEDPLDEVLASLEEVVGIYGEEAERQARLRIEAAKNIKKVEVDILSSNNSKNPSLEAMKKAEKLEAALLKKIAALQRKTYKKDVLELAAAGRGSLGITGEEWDRDPWLLGCQNGVIYLKTGSFRPGKREDYLLAIAPTQWKGIEEPAPTWDRFLWEIFNNDWHLIAYSQRLFGYAITGLRTEHILPILWGKGWNGKGTLLETLQCVLGPLAGPIKAEMLLEQGRARASNTPDSDIMALRGRRLAWASETDEGRKLNAGKVKWLVGGDTLVGRAPFGRREVNFPPTHTLCLLTNHKPKADPNDYALWQRISLVPFILSFVADPKKTNERFQDPFMANKLKAEASGILAWLVRGCLTWQKEGLKPPDIVRAATAKYRVEEDVIGRFLDECCLIGQSFQVKAGELYKAYREWCEVNGHRPLAGNKLGECLPEQFDQDNSGRHRFYLGLGLKTGQE